jgi:hypothetical protein
MRAVKLALRERPAGLATKEQETRRCRIALLSCATEISNRVGQ